MKLFRKYIVILSRIKVVRTNPIAIHLFSLHLQMRKFFTNKAFLFEIIDDISQLGATSDSTRDAMSRLYVKIVKNPGPRRGRADHGRNKGESSRRRPSRTAGGGRVSGDQAVRRGRRRSCCRRCCRCRDRFPKAKYRLQGCDLGR